jgi:hypothetical protein
MVPNIGLCTYVYKHPFPYVQATTFEDFFLKGHTALLFRGRFEQVDDKAYRQLGIDPKYNGHATTLSSRLTYNTARFCHFFGVLDFNNVTSYQNDHHNSGSYTAVSKIHYAQIPDPKGTALVQSFLGYQGIPATDIYLGRQAIRLDNERFVGPSDFRQMPQTFDAVSLVNHSLNNVELYYSFISQVNTIWQGNESALEQNRKNHTHLFNMSSALSPFGEIITYDYVINDQDIPTNSTNTFGVRLTGTYDIPYAILYGLGEYARQHDRNNNPVDYHANYYHLNGGVKIYMFDIGAGYEVLDGDANAAGKAFKTPLGSQHIFNGLADKFVVIPDEGLRDLYFALKVGYSKLQLFTQYHHFKAEALSRTYGHEWDYGIKYSFLNHYSISGEFSDFSGRP